jgi:hypothetical protein
MLKTINTVAIAAAASAGLLMATASPSLACWVSASECHEGAAPAAAHERPLYNSVPGATTTGARSSTQPSSVHEAHAAAQQPK